jgi:glycosyl transferase family 25
MIDKIYCINLDRRHDRWAQFQKEIHREGMVAERFSAIDGNDFKLSYPCDNGNNACTLSHLSILLRAKYLGFRSVMIFEDDAELAQGFWEKLNCCLQDLPQDWNMLYLGASHKDPPIKITDRIYRLQKSFCTHAYIINSNMFDTMIRNFTALDQPCDCFYTVLQRDFKMFITNPPLAWQRGGYSDIVKREMHYPWIKEAL